MMNKKVGVCLKKKKIYLVSAAFCWQKMDFLHTQVAPVQLEHV